MKLYFTQYKLITMALELKWTCKKKKYFIYSKIIKWLLCPISRVKNFENNTPTAASFIV